MAGADRSNSDVPSTDSNGACAPALPVQFGNDPVSREIEALPAIFHPKNGSQPAALAKRGALPRTFPRRKARKAALRMILQRPP